MGACAGRTQGGSIAEAIGPTEDAPARVHSAARRHRLHSGSSSKARIGAVLAVAALAGGGAAWKAAGDGGAHPLAWRDLSGRIAPIEFPQPAFRIFQQARTFAGFQRSEMPGVAPRSSGVDFHETELVVLAAGPRSSTGYAVRVVRVEERRRSILVVARESTPSLGQTVEPHVTYPYRLIALPRSDKTVHVDWLGE